MSKLEELQSPKFRVTLPLLVAITTPNLVLFRCTVMEKYHQTFPKLQVPISLLCINCLLYRREGGIGTTARGRGPTPAAEEGEEEEEGEDGTAAERTCTPSTCEETTLNV